MHLNNSSISSIRRTGAYVMAAAVCELFPETQLVAANWTQEGFFCDFETEQPIDELALPLIEEKMRGLVKTDRPIEQREMMRENAAELFRHRGLRHKIDQTLAADTPTVFIAHLGKFCDYVPYQEESELLASTGSCRAFKILSISRAKLYTRELGEFSVLRILGTACADLPALKQWLKKMKGAQKCDHLLKGKQQQLFLQTDALFPGSWSWLPRGMELREALLNIWRREVQAQKYQLIQTPPFLADESASFEFEEKGYAILQEKAWAHAKLFVEAGYEIADLPIRFAELAELFVPLPLEQTVGLFQSRFQLRDTLHLFCTTQQALICAISSLQFFEQMIKIFAFEPHWVLLDSRPTHSPVKQGEWRSAAQLLKGALEGAGIVAERSPQLAEKYGPRLEMRLSDSLERKWPVATLGVDPFHPEKLGLRSVVMLTGSLFGSLERLVALLLENGADLNSVLRRAKPG